MDNDQLSFLLYHLGNIKYDFLIPQVVPCSIIPCNTGLKIVLKWFDYSLWVTYYMQVWKMYWGSVW
jgi:hypothetical protein